MEFKKYNKCAGIYKWQNKINGKCYIGQSIDLGSRLRHHINNFKHRRYDAPIYRAFDKYGLDNFDVEILYCIENPEHCIKPLLDELEIGYIEKYNSYGGTGYNQTRGGDAGILGYKFTEEQRRKVGRNSIVAGKNNSRRAVLYNVETKWTVIFPCMSFAAKMFNVRHGQISRLCQGKQFMLYDKWIGALSEDDIPRRISEIKNRVVLRTSNYANRKRPMPGLKRHFNTPDGKKIISEEQREKIRNSLFRYKIELYERNVLIDVYENSVDLNNRLFHRKDHNLAMKDVKRYIKNGWKYKKKYTFKLVDKKK